GPSCVPQQTGTDTEEQSLADPRVQVVLDWNKLAAAQSLLAPLPSARRSRIATITEVAVFEAVNSIIGGYEPYAIRVDAPEGANPEAAVAAAAYTSLVSLLPAAKPTFDAQYAASLAAISDDGKADGIAVGVSAATQLLALR